MLDVVNMAVGSLAIILSIISIIVSLVYSSKASATLEKVKDKAEAIEKDVHDRLDDLVKRAAPSEVERAMSAVLPDLFKSLFADPEKLWALLQEEIKRKRQEPK